MKNKIKCKKGSAMQLAIIALLLVSICITSISSMVINQTKNNMKSSQNTGVKYNTESGVDEVIAKFIEEIESSGEKSVADEFDILHKYVEITDILVGSNGIVNATISNILNNMKIGIVTKTDMQALSKSLEETMQTAGASNPDAKELLGIAKKYADFFSNYFFNEYNELDLKNIKYNTIKEFVNLIIENLAEIEFERGNGNNKVTDKGNISVVYRDISLNKNHSKNIDNIYQAFITNPESTNITIQINKNLETKKTEDEINEWAKKNVDKLKSLLIKDSYKYSDAIKREIELINKGGYLNEKELKHYYSTTGNPNYRQIVTQRLKIINYEIDMLIQWLEYMEDLSKINSSSGSESESIENLIITVPKEINLPVSNDDEVKKTLSIVYNETNKTDNINNKTINLIDDSEKLKFEILKPGLGTKIILNLKIQSQIDGYTIESDVDVKIYEILNKNEYKVDYEVKDWKKVN